MVTKVNKLKPTIVEDVKVKPTLAESINEDVKNLFAKYDIAVPSWTRVIVSGIACFAVGFGIGYVGAILVESLVIAALTFTGSLFIGVAIYILGVMATLFVSFKAGVRLNDFIVSGDIDRCYEKCSTSVRGFFSFGNKEVAA